MTEVDRRIANLDGAAELPRKNGELVFRAPWEGRAFGMAVALNDRGAYPWESFSARLAERIATGEPEYYRSWLETLESLLLERGIVTPEELEKRAAEYVALERDPVF